MRDGLWEDWNGGMDCEKTGMDCEKTGTEETNCEKTGMKEWTVRRWRWQDWNYLQVPFTKITQIHSINSYIPLVCVYIYINQQKIYRWGEKKQKKEELVPNFIDEKLR